MTAKICPKCQGPVEGRKKFCCSSCKWWYNSIKRDNEKHLPPVRKRNASWFHMIIGKHQLRPKGQGRRSGGTVRGSMSCAMYIFCPTEVIAEVTAENLHRHFTGNSFPVNTARLCDGSILTKDEYILQISAK